MSIADTGKVFLFSGMSGVITLDGAPVKNAKITRIVDYEKKESDETSTNEKGEFSLAPISKRTVAKLLPQEFVVSQQLIVDYEGKRYEIWNGIKRNSDENSESRGKPLVVACELNSEEKYIKVNNSPIFSLCSWDVEPDPKEDIF